MIGPRLSPPPGRIFGLVDLCVLLALAAGIYGIVTVARQWSGVLQPVAEIHLQSRFLPVYMLYSVTRGIIAYGISFLFTMIYGYAAARIKGADRIMLPILDILQSIPVLGFLPGFVVGLVHLFPHRNLGLEMSSVLMIFTGQVWNMVFAFYASLKSVPEDLAAVAQLSNLSWWQRFFRLDLSFAANSLVWNSMMSMAGGWFFLTVSEAFVLGKHDFRLPGVGSYMSVAIEQGNLRAQWQGILAMMAIIVSLDQLVWRPLVAWSKKFSAEEIEQHEGSDSWLLNVIQRSQLLRGLRWIGDQLRHVRKHASGTGPRSPDRIWNGEVVRWIKRITIALFGAAVIYGLLKYVHLLRDIGATEWKAIFVSALLTFGRVMAAVALASIWTVPAGVAIGRNPRWARALQPIIQILASFPAPMVFPFAVGMMLLLGIGLGVGSIVLLLLGTQWYILFNVIAGVARIPPELWEVARLNRLSWRQRWQKLILPGIFPSLLIGWMTAAGGAWNASIVAEYIRFKGQMLATTGLGAFISQATDEGKFHLLAAAVTVMALAVVSFNRLVWRPLSVLAQSRFQFSP